jgi:hypothetical protein
MNTSVKWLLSETLLSDEQLRAVGCLALEATHLEIYIEAIIRGLCEFDENKSKVFLDRLMIGAKTDIMRDLIWPIVRDTPQGNEFKVIYDDIKDLIAKRNTVIHGDWGLNLTVTEMRDSILTRRGKAIAKRKWKSDEVKADEVTALAHRFAQRQLDLLTWCFEHVLQSSPDKQE